MSWYAVKNVADDSAEISIYDEIGLFGITAKDFISELKSLGSRHVTLRINSPGGSIFDGNAIYNALRRHAAGVTVAIDSLAASMATVIAMAGEKRTMAANGMFMIHNPWMLTAGESKDLRRMAEVMDDLKNNVVSAYAGRTGMERNALSTMMDDETWLTAEEAKQHGFITAITEPMEANARFSGGLLGRFDKTPQAIMAKTTLPAFLATLAATLSLEGEAHTETSIVDAINALMPLQVENSRLSGLVAAKDIEITAHLTTISDHVSTIALRDKSITDLTKERDDSITAHGETTKQRDILKKMAGLAPAAVIPAIAPGESDTGTLAEQYEAMPAGPARLAFFEKHKEALRAALSAPRN